MAKSSLNGEKYSECTVTVRSLDVTVEGVLMDDQSTPMRFSWEMANGQQYVACRYHAGLLC